MKYFKLIRIVNLLILALTQYLFKYFLIDYYYNTTALTDFQFFLLVFSTVCIAAAGYVINDIQDVNTDTNNKPTKVLVGREISEKTANSIYLALNSIGIIIGFYLSYAVDKPNYAMVFVFSSGLLYMYATNLKNYVVVANISIAILTAVSILIIGLFEILPIYGVNDAYEHLNKHVFTRLLVYSGFAFYLNFLREIVKDVEDIDGDYNTGRKTIPIEIGVKRTGMLIAILTFLLIALLFGLGYTYFFSNEIVIGYLLFAVLLPLFFIAIKASMATKKTDFKILKNVLKGTMVTGICLVIIIHQFVLTK
ncbi:geranylgeranylglycerol-phosphate geranylgeranyltransferase [Neptunitalea lumnitzerae]|uniref:Prenyltransferase n=1 Tax=Neptunitalea lumnitzerae TaxID=2965509 RepID=A0ABQ5MJF2_9FLAO|nr:geranylgeranylglycerol-phosphate geranylgeranyltransferase [Neptunitalea sp. Y10]GLB49546.1 prenyltransferase [Neptunitalea sp. Y10]